MVTVSRGKKNNECFIYYLIVLLSIFFLCACNKTDNKILLTEAHITQIESEGDYMRIYFEYIINDNAYSGEIKNTYYPDYGLSIDERAGIQLIDLDEDEIPEIIIKVKCIGNTLSNTCGELHIIKVKENGYEEILCQGDNWSVPEGKYLMSLITQDNKLYYYAGSKEVINDESVVVTKLYRLFFLDGKPYSEEASLDDNLESFEW